MELKTVFLSAILVIFLTSCSAAPQTQASYDPATLRFDGQRAYELENEFVTKFPYRASGMPNSKLAVDWLKDQFTSYGWDCQIDEWEVFSAASVLPCSGTS
jgi:hypothetical protein